MSAEGHSNSQRKLKHLGKNFHKLPLPNICNRLSLLLLLLMSCLFSLLKTKFCAFLYHLFKKHFLLIFHSLFLARIIFTSLKINLVFPFEKELLPSLCSVFFFKRKGGKEKRGRKISRVLMPT